MVTPDEVYRAIVTVIGDALVLDDKSRSRVAIVEDENIDLSSDFFVQVKPAGGTLALPRVGLELVDDRVEISTWVREYKEAGGKRTLQVAGEGRSLFAMLELIRSAVRGSDLNGLLVLPFRHTSIGSPVSAAKASGFVRVRDVWAITYELGGTGDSSEAAAALNMLWSATAPTTAAGASGGSINATLTPNRVATTPAYLWCLSRQSLGDIAFWSEAGLLEFYGTDNLPPDGPTCGTVTIGDVVFRQWRSPYLSSGTYATYRVRNG